MADMEDIDCNTI
ncbi:hypothetical protein CGLO_02574 [Colletotrichum gloeosporioides Cg-14]|uniref:Uncharacterized protein n=1 Tax=Colletotrichum gloeosporioides (strain Cg-14) TaxID=1237896 RepID=T0M8H4_COLGC|nr:hypothetical protein CGLO_02574 [Colletotrichum gloeosporioides Cg-14]